HVAPVRPSTYPVFFWVSRLLQENSKLIDYGGSIGLTYYGFRQRSSMPAGALWIVVELQSLVAEGRRAAVKHNAVDLQFMTDLASVPQGDILLAAGALQYMSESVPGLLEKLLYRPR